MVKFVHDLNFLVDVLLQVCLFLEGGLTDGLGCKVIATIILDEENLTKGASTNNFDGFVIMFLELVLNKLKFHFFLDHFAVGDKIIHWIYHKKQYKTSQTHIFSESKLSEPLPQSWSTDKKRDENLKFWWVNHPALI